MRSRWRAGRVGRRTRSSRPSGRRPFRSPSPVPARRRCRHPRSCSGRLRADGPPLSPRRRSTRRRHRRASRSSIAWSTILEHPRRRARSIGDAPVRWCGTRTPDRSWRDRSGIEEVRHHPSTVLRQDRFRVELHTLQRKVRVPNSLHDPVFRTCRDDQRLGHVRRPAASDTERQRSRSADRETPPIHRG